MSFEFVDELPLKGGNGTTHPILVEFAEAIRTNPGRWAKYPIELSPRTRASVSSTITRNVATCPKPFRGGGFQSRIVAGAMYVRYVGLD